MHKRYNKYTNQHLFRCFSLSFLALSITSQATTSEALSFTPIQRLTLHYGHDAAMGDLDGDGDIDIVVAIRSTSVSSKILLNDGKGFMQEKKSVDIPGDTYAIELFDADQDNDLDIITGNLNKHTNQLWLNDGAANFTLSPQHFVFPSTFSTMDVIAADLNNDKFSDLIFANVNGPNSVWFNRGQAQFEPSKQSLGNNGSTSVAAADLDNDGDKDLVFANISNIQTTGHHNQIWLNSGSGRFTPGRAFDGSDSRGIAIGDMDGDGLKDFVIANSVNQYGEGSSQIFLNAEDMNLKRIEQVLDSPRHFAYDVALYDVDNDTDLDVYLSFSGARGDALFLNKGDGLLENSGLKLDHNTLTFKTLINDFNGDGIADIFSVNGFSQSVMRLGQTSNLQHVAKKKPVTGSRQ